MRRNDTGKLREKRCCLAVLPTADVLQRLRGVPMKERDPRRDAVLQQQIDYFIIISKALLVARSPIGEDARPTDAETVVLDAER